MSNQNAQSTQRFNDLFTKELEEIRQAKGTQAKGTQAKGTGGGATPSTPLTLDPGKFTDEPKATKDPEGLFGVVLSGGGIRSATFNLGVLQGLQSSGLLEHADYLSTVSGGGYIGGWYSKLLSSETAGQGSKGALGFRPSPDVRNDPEVEPARHVREYSRFLAPNFRWLGQDVVRLLGHALAVGLFSLLGSVALLYMLMGVWVVFLYVSASASSYAATAVVAIAAVMLAFFVAVTVDRWISAPEQRPLFFTLCGVTVVVCAFFPGTSVMYPIVLVTLILLIILIGLVVTVCMYRPPARRLFTNAALWCALFWAGALWFMPAPAVTPFAPTRDEARNIERELRLSEFRESLSPRELAEFDASGEASIPDRPLSYTGTLRLAGRTTVLVWSRMPWHALVELATLGGALLLCLLLRLLIFLFPSKRSFLERATVVSARSFVAGAGAAAVWNTGVVVAILELDVLFALLAPVLLAAFEAARRVLEPATGNARRAGLTFRDRAAAHIPKLLATTALLSISVLCASTCVDALWAGNLYIVVGVAFVALCLFWFFADPHHHSLFSFYRGRIARAYLGASSIAAQDASNHRDTCETPEDNIALKDLPARPLHLVNVAVNDLAGSPLAALQRGAASGVISRYGFATGDRYYTFADKHEPSFASALTASGAAVNPNMGEHSLRVGRAGTILLTAFNFRLGMWISTKDGQWRTWPWHKRGSAFFHEMFGRTRAVPADGSSGHDYHVSDGGHFENLGVYELLRRHCSYILVSDATADPNLDFDELGNLLQLAREDFGIEIEIDVSEIRPDESGRSYSRVAVGRIFYPEGALGLLLYIKPVLTGSEPADVLQYHASNPGFPHDSTVNQFYHHAQWEAYRALGYHTARTIFRFTTEFDPALGRIPESKDMKNIEWVFQRARSVWAPMPDSVVRSTVEANEIYLSLVAESGRAGGTTGSGAVRHARIIQHLENVWTRCHLSEYLFHKATSGWYDAFEETVSDPSFLESWHLLKWQFNREFASFMEQRFFWLREAPPETLASGDQILFECRPTTACPGAMNFVQKHPRRYRSGVEYGNGWVYGFLATGGARQILVAIPALQCTTPQCTTPQCTKAGKSYIELRDLLIRPGTGGLTTAARALRKLMETEKSNWVNAFLVIRSTADQDWEPDESDHGGQSRSRRNRVAEIHRRAAPFIEAGLGKLEFLLASRSSSGSIDDLREEEEGTCTGAQGDLVGVVQLR